MSLTDEVSFDKEGNIEKPWLKKFFLSLVIIFVSLISFGLGLLYGGGVDQGIKLEFDPNLVSGSQSRTQSANAASAAKTSLSSVYKAGEVIASSKGTKYHYPHCPGAKQISEANKLIFDSAEAAEASGYTLAGNCRPK